MLKGESDDVPEQWLISRVCESFSCPPEVAEHELERDPELVLDILQLRAYAETSRAMDAAKSENDAPKGPMADLWADIEIEAMQGRRGELSEE